MVHESLYRKLGLSKEKSRLLQHHIDGPAKIFGPRHRKFNHSWRDIAMFCTINGMEYALPYASHIIVDELASKDKKLKAALEYLAAIEDL